MNVLIEQQLVKYEKKRKNQNNYLRKGKIF